MISFAVGFAREPFVSSQVISAVMPILYGGVISIGIAYTLQIVAQRNAKPSHAAIILSLESVFAVFLGWLILGELLSTRIILGCILMLSGMMTSKIRPRGSGKAD